jgi:predicted RNA-binding protein
LQPLLFIDLSDTPPVLHWSRTEIGRFYRLLKKLVTMRLDSDIIAWLKADGRGYQTKANWLVRQPGFTTPEVVAISFHHPGKAR